MRLIDATVAADALEVGAALAAVLSAARRQLDSAGVDELDRAIASLRAE